MPEKTLNNTSVKKAKDQVSDLEVFGNGDTWRLICKASSESEGWMKSTKALQIGGVGYSKGVVLQVTTQQRNPDGSWAIAESICYVPNAEIYETDEDGVITREIV